MQAIRWAAAAVLCALFNVPAAVAQQGPAGQTATPPPAIKYDGAWPVVLSKADDDASEQTTGWSKQEIELAEARCTALLKSLDVVVVPDDPLHEATRCGTPAPKRLVSIGSSPRVAFSPPPVLTCDMVAALHKWMQRDVQPLARKHLGAPIVTVSTMSSYSCRNAYGRRKGRLSEHGRANAVDIGGFETARGQRALVLADWGPIAREIAAQAAAAQKQREAAKPTQPASIARAPAAAPVPVTAQFLRPSISIQLPGISVKSPQMEAPSALGLTEPSRLGGPKGDADAPATSRDSLAAQAQFLRGAHRAACKIFGTVLGPEANNAHKNHFHLDMAERTHVTICN